MDGPQEVAADPKQILNGSVHREKPLRLASGFEPAHLSFSLPGRLVGDFRPIVRVLVRAVNHRRHYGAAGRGVTAQLVGDQSSRDTPLCFQQLPEEAQGPHRVRLISSTTSRPFGGMVECTPTPTIVYAIGAITFATNR